MSVESFIQSMPKVELILQFEGAVQRETMLMLADQNEMRDQVKRFEKWVEQYQNPDFSKLDPLVSMLSSWIQYGDDLTRAIYDIGVSLSKDNIRYAEIAVNPLAFVSGEFTFDEFIEALNDGRDRVERAWGVQMRWVMTIPRSDPRHADEVARWATSATARRGGVVALALVGSPAPKTTLDQFERAFRTAAKKDVARIVYVNEKDNLDEIIELLDPTTIVDAWGVIEEPEAILNLKENNILLDIGLARAQRYGWIESSEEYPLSGLLESEIPLSISTDMPVVFDVSLSDEYLTAYDSGLLTMEQIEEIVFETLKRCNLPEEEKEVLLTTFRLEYDTLRLEHIETGESA